LGQFDAYDGLSYLDGYIKNLAEVDYICNDVDDFVNSNSHLDASYVTSHPTYTQVAGIETRTIMSSFPDAGLTSTALGDVFSGVTGAKRALDLISIFLSKA
jgi:hypothetical protein